MVSILLKYDDGRRLLMHLLHALSMLCTITFHQLNLGSQDQLNVPRSTYNESNERPNIDLKLVSYGSGLR